jgi:hypothetical protein
LQDARCQSIRKLGSLGYVLNDETFLFIKYTTKERSPWRFTFDQEDVDRSIGAAARYRQLIFGFVYGSGGICAIDWVQGCELLGSKPGCRPSFTVLRNRGPGYVEARHFSRMIQSFLCLLTSMNSMNSNQDIA